MEVYGERYVMMSWELIGSLEREVSVDGFVLFRCDAARAGRVVEGLTRALGVEGEKVGLFNENGLKRLLKVIWVTMEGIWSVVRAHGSVWVGGRRCRVWDMLERFRRVTEDGLSVCSVMGGFVSS